MNVSAKDLGTGREQAITIKSSSGLSEDEIQRMVKDAEAHAAEDEAKKKLIDLRNQADQLVYTTEKTLKEHGDKVDASVRGEIERAVNHLKDVQKGDDPNVIQKAMEEVTAKSHKLAEAIYKATAGKAGAAAGGASEVHVGEAPKAGKDDDVIDAEFEVKK